MQKCIAGLEIFTLWAGPTDPILAAIHRLRAGCSPLRRHHRSANESDHHPIVRRRRRPATGRRSRAGAASPRPAGAQPRRWREPRRHQPAARRIRPRQLWRFGRHGPGDRWRSGGRGRPGARLQNRRPGHGHCRGRWLRGAGPHRAIAWPCRSRRGCPSSKRRRFPKCS